MRKGNVALFSRLFRVVTSVVVVLSAFTLSLVAATPAAAQEVYRNDFESGNTSGWSTSAAPGPWTNPIQIEATPIGGRHFLGRFGPQTASLTLSSLPAHTSVTISFDLFVIRTWDGNGDFGWGPDIFDLTVEGGPTLLHTTFSNTRNPQAYPGTYPGSRYDARTGAVENNTLGFVPGDPADSSVYRLSFTFPHSASPIKLNFSASLNQYPGTQNIDDESWGLDNVAVTLSDGRNINILPNSGIQSETSIAINPTNPSNIIAGANIISCSDPSGLSGPQATFISRDGGASWTFVPQSFKTSTGHMFAFGADPFVDFDANGNAYFAYLLFNRDQFGNPTIGAIGVSKSTNGGFTWTDMIPIVDHTGETDPDFEDHEAMAIDKSASSPFRDNIYVAWTKFHYVPCDDGLLMAIAGIFFSRSTDGGTTWSPPIQVDMPSTGNVQFAVPAVGPNGEVYVVWNDYGAHQICIAKSTDGGQHFGQPMNVATFRMLDRAINSCMRTIFYPVPAQPDRGVLPAPSIAVDTCGNVYVEWADICPTCPYGSPDVDIFLCKSTDGGQTWNALGPTPKRVNNDPANSNASQFHGWLTVDPSDNSVYISYYDTRDDLTNQRTHYYLSRSTDGGRTFCDGRITTNQSDESVNNLGRDPCRNNYGDYTSIAALGGIIYPCWTGNRTTLQGLGSENIFVARVIPTCVTDVTTQVSITRSGFRYNRTTQRYVQTVTLKNISSNPIQGPVSLVLDNLSRNANLFNADGYTNVIPLDSPYKNVNVGSDNVLSPGESATVVLEFQNPSNRGITYTTRVLAGPGAR